LEDFAMAEDPFGPRLFFDFMIHEAENIHNRVDWFLIFHGILFEAFLASKRPTHQITLGILGCLVSYVWLVAGIRQLWNLRWLVGKAREEETMGTGAVLYKQILAARNDEQPNWMRWARATPAFCVLLPSAVLVAWLVVTATYTESGISLTALEITAAFIVVLTVAWKYYPEPALPATVASHENH
jgi:hypothetical protein